MKRNTNSYTEIASLRGAPPVAAYYREAELAHHRDNPLLEALDPILSEQDWAEALTNYIDFDPDIRAAPIHIRRQALEHVRALVQPQRVHVRTALDVDCLLRAGYVARNPYRNGRIQLKPVEAAKNSGERTSSNHNRNIVLSHKRTMLNQAMVRGIARLGPSGVGKSTLLRSFLLNYPQVIQHSSYRGGSFMFQQIVWMMLECPHNGSRRQLIHKILDEIDALIGTNYRHSHSKGGIDGTLVPDLERVNAVLRIGMIVIDEVQRLAHVRGSSATEMLEFLVQFSNTVHIPIVLIGTNLASSVITSRLQQIRRVSGYGDIYWPMPREMADDGRSLHADWHILLEALFRYQFIHNPVALNPELSAAFFEKTQGITDLVVTLFILAQERAMRSAEGDESLTPRIIRETADEAFKTLMPALRALQNMEAGALEKYEDLRCLYEQEMAHFAPHEQQATEISTLFESPLNLPEAAKGATTGVKGQTENDSAAEASNEVAGQTEIELASAASIDKDNRVENDPLDTDQQRNVSKPIARKSRRRKPTITDPADLRSCETDETLTPKDAHENWRRRGFTRSADDYISPESDE
jgi:hypothetical protein